ncbi:MAG: 4-hydroxy-tetrahydrodipicolinate synthase, partial [Candidatus Omnitrophica bacterium]|nr:4-hydroxy-tetrahydrodipicolinate synthase [Candidatus Omnitrophota bacterium]
MFKGSFTALITPFDKDGQIDEAKFRELIDFQIENGIEGIVPCGCTGEAATLSHPEQKRLIKITVEAVNKRVPVMAGTGSNSTDEAIGLTEHAKKAGADGVLIITPYYNKPTPRGQVLHYEKIATKVDIPIILYNVPSRTGVSMKPEVIAELSKIDNITAIKEASGSLEQVSQILSLCDIDVLSGDDSLTLPMMALGAKGVVSVAANVVPEEVSSMTKAFLEGNAEKAKELHFKLYPIFKAMFIETNPISVKTAMMFMDMLNGVLRLPLCAMTEENQKKLRSALIKAG